MSLLRLRHGDPTLYEAVGPWALDVTVHRRLGMAVTGQAGDLWVLANRDDAPVGFAQLRPFKVGTLHIRYLFAADPDDQEAEDGLMRELLAIAAETGSTAVYSNDRQGAGVWPRHDFVCAPTARRGNFVKWIRTIPIQKDATP